MSILVLQVFVSLMLVAAAVVLFVYTVRVRTFEHVDRLALAPLADDAPNIGEPVHRTIAPSHAGGAHAVKEGKG